MTLSSSASITGLAVFENVKKLDGKTFVFDAQFFINETQTVVAALRFFNREDYKIEDFATYMVIANVSVPFFHIPDWMTDASLLGCKTPRWCTHPQYRHDCGGLPPDWGCRMGTFL